VTATQATRRAPRPSLHIVETKLIVPPVRPDTVARTELVERLRASPALVVSINAPAGYGKSTLQAQWAASDARPFAWISLDERDNDPVVLLSHLVGALDRVKPGRHEGAEGAAWPRGLALVDDRPRIGAWLSTLERPS
jgi:LuxR family maltose regulon positive regulatory protein